MDAMKALRNPPLYLRSPLRHVGSQSRLRYLMEAFLSFIVVSSLSLASGWALLQSGLLSDLLYPNLGKLTAGIQHHDHPEPFPVTGARTGLEDSNQYLPLRLEIDDFVKDAATLDLYLQCHLQLFQRDPSEPLSYYQIATIHGAPYHEWNGVTGTYNQTRGYAMHRSILFPIWHRPYVAMFEQLISECANDLAERYDHDMKPIYKAAAQNLRLPYWDWARKPFLPDIITEPFRTVQTPEGPSRIINPMYQFDFPSDRMDDLLAGTKAHNTDPVIWNTGSTMRCPNLIDHNMTVNEQLHDFNITLRTFELFTALNGNFDEFSNIGYWDVHHRRSLENVHNVVHLATGTQILVKQNAKHTKVRLCGHMGSHFAAFDPLFFLHHANLDRLFALWQAIYPESYVVPRMNDMGSYLRAPNLTDTIDTPLMPFFEADGKTPYTSRTARHTTTFGYSYPETFNTTMTASELKEHVLQTVHELYGPITQND